MTSGPRPRGRASTPGALALALAWLLAAALSACAVPQDHVHTLRPSPASVPGSVPASEAASHGPAPTVAIGPVELPQALDREAWLVREGPTTVHLLEHQRWPQALGAEIAQSLAERLDARRTTGQPWAWPDAAAPGFATRPGLRVRLQVLRFDSLLRPDAAVAQAWRWSLECTRAEGGSRVLRSAIHEVLTPVAAPPEGQARLDALARAHADALDALAGALAAALREAGTAADCPGA